MMGRSRYLSIVVGLALVLSLSVGGCGQSVQDDRAAAYTQLGQMSELGDDGLMYRGRLDGAADKAAIEQIVSEAQALNDSRVQEAQQKAQAAQDAQAKREADFEEQLDLSRELVGMKLTLTQPKDETQEDSVGTSFVILAGGDPNSGAITEFNNPGDKSSPWDKRLAYQVDAWEMYPKFAEESQSGAPKSRLEGVRSIKETPVALTFGSYINDKIVMNAPVILTKQDDGTYYIDSAFGNFISGTYTAETP